MLKGAFHNDFPAVGGVKAHKDICKQNDNEGFGTIAETINHLINPGFEGCNFLPSRQNKPSKDNEGDEIGKNIFDGFLQFFL